MTCAVAVAHPAIRRSRAVGSAVAVVGLLLVAGEELALHAHERVAPLWAAAHRLAADLRASERELRQSRAILVETGDRERLRIAQNLHDGLQAELVLLAVEAQRLAGLPGTPTETAEAATRLRARIDRAAADLRDLVHDVMPAPLIERGLVAATEDLVDRMPVAASLDATLDGPLPSLVQSTAYFLVAEALGNAVKHAEATKVAVRFTRVDTVLLVEVDDDGVGGARLGAGLGLRGIADRIAVLGGRLRLDSPAAGGTHIVAELPCEW